MSNLSVRVTHRVPATFPKRLKVAAAQQDSSIGDFLEKLLADHEAKLDRARKSQASPLHRPVV